MAGDRIYFAGSGQGVYRGAFGATSIEGVTMLAPGLARALEIEGDDLFFAIRTVLHRCKVSGGCGAIEPFHEEPRRRRGRLVRGDAEGGLLRAARRHDLAKGEVTFVQERRADARRS